MAKSVTMLDVDTPEMKMEPLLEIQENRYPLKYATQTRITINTHIGTTLPEAKPDNSLCISKYTNEFSEICHTTAIFSVDTLCITEHNLDTSHHTSHQKLYQTAQTIYDHTKLTPASSSIPATNSSKPGGTLMLSQGPITSQITTTGTNPMG